MKYSYILSGLLIFSACTSYPHLYSPQDVTLNPDYEVDGYDLVVENSFNYVRQSPLSTFSIDVDGASYSNIRRYIMDGSLPPTNAIRIEELINYFDYDYGNPKNDDPFSVHTELAPSPWNSKHQLVQIGVQAKEPDKENLPANNLVFLLDVSGSMRSENKLPLLKKGFKLLVNELKEDDFVSIVVYAGNSGVILPPTSGNKKDIILDALDGLRARGSTAGADGIQQAYKLAMENFQKDANNRIILATDGDFNVGISNDDELISLIEEKRKSGIFLSVLGFGTDNLKDSKIEQIANHGNGNYYYIDNLLEAKKVFVSEMNGTLHTIAKDVKIQVEFNPATVQAYRLIGYENRLLANKDFNDDKKDAGDLGVGHTVTALYEIIPVGVDIDPGIFSIDPLKYQTPPIPDYGYTEELITIKLRYKHPKENQSKLISTTIDKNQLTENLSENLAFASSVASFGMILINSKYKGDSSFEMVNRLAHSGKGVDKYGYRSEFIRITELTELLWQGQSKK